MSGPPAAGRRPLRPLDARVVAIHEIASQGQRIEVEDETRTRWQVDCLGEAVGLGARIRFEPLLGGGRREGVLLRVLEDERERWVCTLRRVGSGLRLVPFGGVELPAFELAARERDRAREGDRVVVVPEREGDSGRKKKVRSGRVRRGSSAGGAGASLPVRIASVLGPAGHPDADHAAIAWKYRLPESFSRRAGLEADALPSTLAPAELARRLDLRALPFVTIDPASARDHDDALFAEAAPADERSRYAERLWVAIADVAHFVVEGGFVDAEARRRGNSFYFPDRATPMLPERLSSDLCSLRPGEDRLVLAVELRLSARGEVVESRFHEAVIRSQAKLAYEEAAERLARWRASDGTGEAGDEGTPPVLRDSLTRLARISERLGEARRAAGSIELELPEVEIEVDVDGRVVDVRLRTRNPAHGLVEEAMLAANRAVASALDRVHREAIHRIHPPPDPRRLEELARLLERHGFVVEAPLEEPGAIAAMLRRVHGLPSEERIHLATLRSMSQARYAARSGGHFALRFDHYLHFTSPIRRYADLAVHRVLKRWLRREDPDRPVDAPTRDSAPRDAAAGPRASELERLASWLSGRERVATEAERDAAAFACCALLEGREGERFEVEVTGVTEHGLFVRGLRPAASGLIPLRTLGQRFELDVEAETLVLAGSLRPIEIGSRLDVRLLSVDGDRGRVAFELESSARGRRGRDAFQGVERVSDRDSHSR
ncbi:MAG: VacB/RNase II family 3'-5' exoribonuclease [Deltaproteobacteria bacterium]|nr:VacB/RNase II family 3'-5' exoribonuclease [Deltaproteobacteria bacterium]